MHTFTDTAERCSEHKVAATAYLTSVRRKCVMHLTASDRLIPNSGLPHAASAVDLVGTWLVGLLGLLTLTGLEGRAFGLLPWVSAA